MPKCNHCEKDKPEGKTDAGDYFYCTDCIDDEDMVACEDCGDMFSSGDLMPGSAYGRVCKPCHNYRSDMV